MTALTVALQVLVVILSFALTLLILLHKGKGGGLTDSFVGASSSGVAERNLNRYTVVVGLLWVALIVALDLM